MVDDAASSVAARVKASLPPGATQSHLRIVYETLAPDQRAEQTGDSGQQEEFIVSSYIHLVFSQPPATVSDDEYNTWYDAHVQEILSVEGWESATRYAVEGVVGVDGSKTFRFLSLYELSVPPDVAVANLAAANIGNADSYIDEKGADESKLPLPDWFTAVEFSSWNCTQISERITLHTATASSR